MSYKFASDTLYTGSALVASFSSDVVDLKHLNAASFQVVMTCSGVSWTVAVQGSNDGVTYIDTATPTAVTTSVNLMLSIADVTSRYYRVNFVRTSGTMTTASVVFAAKG